MPKVSVIIVNYNGKGLIRSCLQALERQSLGDFEVVIVDNASLDGSLYEIKEILEGTSIASRVNVIPVDRNLGFAGGNIEFPGLSVHIRRTPIGDGQYFFQCCLIDLFS